MHIANFKRKAIPLIPYGLAVVYLGVVASGLLLWKLPFYYLLGVVVIGQLLGWSAQSRLGSVLALILTGLAIQLTGSISSPLFFFYYLFGLILAYRVPIRRFWLLSGVIILSELGANRRPDLLFYLVPMMIYFGLIGYFRHRELEERRGLELRAQHFRAQRDLVEPGEVDRSRVIQSLVRDRAGIGDLELPFRSVVEFIVKSLRPNSCILWVRQGDELVPVEFSSRDPVCIPGPQGLEIGLVGWVAREGRPLLIPDFFSDARSLGYYRGPNLIRSFLAVPVRLGDEVLGVLSVDARERAALGIEQQAILETGAYTLAQIIDVVRRYGIKHQEALRYSAIAEFAASLLQNVKRDEVIGSALAMTDEVFAPARAGFARVDVPREVGVVAAVRGRPIAGLGEEFDLSDGLVGWVAKHNGYLINNNLTPLIHRVARDEPKVDTRSFLGVPLRDESGCFGVLWLEKDVANAFSERDARVLEFLGILLSVALNRAQLYEEVEELAIRDGLTRLYNHRKFQELLDAKIASAKSFTLLFLDLDHFKQINDEFGHRFGDEILRGVARVLSAFSLVAARYGGEEFGVVLEGADRAEAMERAEELRRRVKELRVKREAHPEGVGLTVSIGLARYPEDGSDKARLLDAADQALYWAKRTGRDRIVAYWQINTGS